MACFPTAPFTPTRFDTPDEGVVFGLLRQWTEDGGGWCVLSQVEIASLVPSAPPEQHERVDLVAVHPALGTYVIEVDGEGHQNEEEKDNRRDATLSDAGFPTIRVPNDEARAGRGPKLSTLKTALAADSGTVVTSSLGDTFRLFKFLHQVQLTVLTAIHGGWVGLGGPWRVGVVPPAELGFNSDAEELVALACSELADLLKNLQLLHGMMVEEPEIAASIIRNAPGENLDIIVVFTGGEDSTPALGQRFEVSDIAFPADIAAPGIASKPISVQTPSREAARWFLNYLFRKPEFLEGQWEALSRALQGLDSVVLLPTGGGKSIAFQMAALLLPGRCVVVDPIISLIDDQIDNLGGVGVDRCVGITSQVGSGPELEPLLRAFSDGSYLFCYVAPERFQMQSFRDHLRKLTVTSPVSLITIDEAHCISEWGHDFRIAYLNLGRIAREYCADLPPKNWSSYKLVKWSW